MKLNNKEIDALRDGAIFYEDTNIQLSCDLMNKALFYRPHGGFIRRKVAEYNQVTKPSNDFAGSLKEACKSKFISPFILKEILNIALSILPDDKELRDIESRMIFSLMLKVSILESQVVLLRSKFNQIHKAICYSDVLKIKEIDDHAAKLSPVELINKNAFKTLIVFGGMATRPSMPPKEFFSSFADKDVNILYVKDFQQCWYLNGLMGVTDDIESTVIYLKNLIPQKTEELVCLGTSAGGYAAIRIGVELKADRILAFSPQTNIDKKVFERFKSIDSRLTEINFSKKNLNLRSFLSGMSNLNIEIHYGELNKNDRIAAKNIQDYVKLYAYPFNKHNIASYLKKNGELQRILNEIVGF